MRFIEAMRWTFASWRNLAMAVIFIFAAAAAITMVTAVVQPLAGSLLIIAISVALLRYALTGHSRRKGH